MKLKTYTGRSLEELAPQIREELGPGRHPQPAPELKGGVGGFFGTKSIEVLAPTAAGRTRRGGRRRARRRTAHGATAGGDSPSSPARQVDTHGAREPESLLPRPSRRRWRRGWSRRSRRYEGASGSSPPAAAHPRAPLREPRTAAARSRWSRSASAPRAPTAAACGSRRSRSRPAPLDDESADLAIELERAGLTPAAADALVREVHRHVEPFASGRLRDLVVAASPRACASSRAGADGTARRIAVVGASGVGKTTAIANLAAGYASAGMMVGIVVVDRPIGDGHPVLPRLGAAAGSEADRALAYMAGADVLRVTSAAEIKRGMSRLSMRDVVLIDTPGSRSATSPACTT